MSAEFTSADFVESLRRVAAVMAEQRDELCRLDGVVGDGDHGLAMADGFAAAARIAANEAPSAAARAAGAQASTMVRSPSAALPRATIPSAKAAISPRVSSSGISFRAAPAFAARMSAVA